MYILLVYVVTYMDTNITYLISWNMEQDTNLVSFLKNYIMHPNKSVLSGNDGYKEGQQLSALIAERECNQ
jgi:hypothetical protein